MQKHAQLHGVLVSSRCVVVCYDAVAYSIVRGVSVVGLVLVVGSMYLCEYVRKE
jgi:NADH:ubiquinone oxidoreductase subunit H